MIRKDVLPSSVGETHVWSELCGDIVRQDDIRWKLKTEQVEENLNNYLARMKLMCDGAPKNLVKDVDSTMQLFDATGNYYKHIAGVRMGAA